MPKVGLRATAGTKTLSYGLVQVRVGMMPALVIGLVWLSGCIAVAVAHWLR